MAMNLSRTKSAGSADMDRFVSRLGATNFSFEEQNCCMSDPECELEDEAEAPPSSSDKDSRCRVAHLPENVVRVIAKMALQAGGRQNSVLALLALCGVCRHWRRAASSVESDACLIFDGAKASNSTANSTYEQKFRMLPQSERTRVLLAAAKLLRGMLFTAHGC